MPVFISHSFENAPEFENIADAFEAAGVAYWNPAEVRAGNSLREQLRAAAANCAVCVFVATRNSIDSSWCGAELGAFWGLGKPIIVYLAEASLPEDKLPPIVHGDVWERRITRVVARARELLEETSTASSNGELPSPRVGNMTMDQLERLIVGAVSLAAATGKSEGHPGTPAEISQAARGAASRMLEGIRSTARASKAPDNGWHRKILWVDDNPANNRYERATLESLGMEFTLALSTQEALEELHKQRFAAIISDMGRREGRREGYVILEEVRKIDKNIPFFIYAASNASKHKQEAALRGAQGSTNVPRELVDMILQALPSDDGA